jgi:hypothetical protein
MRPGVDRLMPSRLGRPRATFGPRSLLRRHVDVLAKLAICGGQAGVWGPLMAVMVAMIITVAVPIPMMIVLAATVIAFPIAFVETLAIMTGHRPHSTGIGRARPVSVMPPIMMAYRIPIAFHPNEPRCRSDRPDANDSRRRRWADADSNRYLSEQDSSHEEQERQQLLCHRGRLCSAGAIWQVVWNQFCCWS